MTTSILVVIPTYNEATTIEHVITSLTQGLPSSINTKFVVVDGGSRDGSQEVVKKLSKKRTDILLLDNPKKIQSAAINLAARTFGKQTDILIRCDAHAEYPNAYIKDLLETLNETSASSVVVPMDSVGKNCLQNAIAWVSNSFIGTGGSAHRGGQNSGFVDHGHHAAFCMDTFNTAGGYDESFTHNEDAEFDCRQRALGAKIYLDAKIRLGYYPRKRLIDLWRQYFSYGKGRSRTVRRHPNSIRLRQLAVPIHLLVSIVAITLGYWFPFLLIWPIFYLLTLSLVALRLVIQHSSVCGFLAAPCAFVMHTAWAMGFYWGLLSIRESIWDITAVSPLWSPNDIDKSYE